MTIQEMESRSDWQTRARAGNWNEYKIYLACADDGHGLDITNPGEPLASFDEWLSR